MERRQFDPVFVPSQALSESADQRRRDRSVRRRLEQICTPDEVDLLYKMVVEGVSPAALARELECHRATPTRRLRRLLGRLRQDPKLQHLAVSA